MNATTASAYRVLVRLGCFNFLDPTEKSTSLHIAIPGLEVANLALPPDAYEHLSTNWRDAALEGFRRWQEPWVYTDRKQVHAVQAWLADEANQDRLYLAWVAYILPQKEKRLENLTKEVEELRRSAAFANKETP